MAGGQPAAAADFSPSVDYRTVKRGSTGLWVENLQAALGLQVNGRFDAGTEAALEAYQAANGLEVDGIAGRATYRSLGLLA